MNQTLFRYCPSCKSASFRQISFKEYKCRTCGFNYFVNVATAVAALLIWQDRLLLSIRKNPPAAGMLDLPGGFVDPCETAEEGLKRELLEELDLKVNDLRYLCSYPNRYDYNGVCYHTLDLFYQKTFDHKPRLCPRDDILDAQWVNTTRIDYSAIAFSSMRNGIKFMLNHRQTADNEI